MFDEVWLETLESTILVIKTTLSDYNLDFWLREVFQKRISETYSTKAEGLNVKFQSIE